jgi:hypothetical protein
MTNETLGLEITFFIQIIFTPSICFVQKNND